MREGHGAGDCAGGAALAEPAELALSQPSVRHGDIAITGGDSRCGIGNRTGTAAAAATPEHVAEADMLHAQRGGDVRRVVAVVAEGGEAVDVADVDARVIGGELDRVQGHLELWVGGGAAFVVTRLAEPNDGRAPADSLVCHRSPHRPPVMRHHTGRRRRRAQGPPLES